MPSFRQIAAQIHANQRYGEHPYTYHLAAAEEVLHRFNVATPDRVQAIWFHDAKEDQGQTDAQLLSYGLTVRAVDAVSRVTDEAGANRKERKLKTYPKIAASEDAIIDKLADRIANIEESIRSKSHTFATYCREQAEFKRQLGQSPSKEAKPMWDYIDRLLTDPHITVPKHPGIPCLEGIEI